MSDLDFLAAEAAATRSAFAATAARAKASLVTAQPLRRSLRRHPWQWAAGGAALGLVAGLMVWRRARRPAGSQSSNGHGRERLVAEGASAGGLMALLATAARIAMKALAQA